MTLGTAFLDQALGEPVTEAAAKAEPLLLADPTTVFDGVLDEDIAPTERASHVDRLLAVARSQIGVCEKPAGSNNNPYSKYFGYGAQRWCADFVSWVVDSCGNHDHKVPWGYPSAVRNITNWGSHEKRLHEKPRRGDIFTRRDGGHTGFVDSVTGTKFHTIEGNCGNCVNALARDAAGGTYWFITAP